MNKEYSFLFNIGAEKAATTWLYHYLIEHPDFVDPPTKEMNVLRMPSIVPTHYYENQYLFEEDLKYYFNFFENKIRFEGGPSGDFTHYEGCTENMLRVLRDGFEKRGIIPKALYIMRDPIDRAVSSYNMLKQYSGETQLKDSPLLDLFLEQYLSCKYIETIEATTGCFGDDVMFVFYEELFNQKTMDMICDFIGIPHEDADFSPVNASEEHHIPSKEFVDKFGLSQQNRDTYQYMKDLFGENRMKSLWRGYDVIGSL